MQAECTVHSLLLQGLLTPTTLSARVSTSTGFVNLPSFAVDVLNLWSNSEFSFSAPCSLTALAPLEAYFLCGHAAPYTVASYQPLNVPASAVWRLSVPVLFQESVVLEDGAQLWLRNATHFESSLTLESGALLAVSSVVITSGSVTLADWSMVFLNATREGYYWAEESGTWRIEGPRNVSCAASAQISVAGLFNPAVEYHPLVTYNANYTPECLLSIVRSHRIKWLAPPVLTDSHLRYACTPRFAILHYVGLACLVPEPTCGLMRDVVLLSILGLAIAGSLAVALTYEERLLNRVWPAGLNTIVLPCCFALRSHATVFALVLYGSLILRISPNLRAPFVLSLWTSLVRFLLDRYLTTLQSILIVPMWWLLRLMLLLIASTTRIVLHAWPTVVYLLSGTIAFAAFAVLQYRYDEYAALHPRLSNRTLVSFSGMRTTTTL